MLDEPLFDDPLPPNPLAVLADWFEFAKTDSNQPHWEAVTLITASPDAVPSARVVLLKDYEIKTGLLTIHTNYNSRKCREINANPRVALNFHWDHLRRQIRIDGVARKATPEVSDAYFKTRPRESQIGAWASVQSDTLDSWETLFERVAYFAMKFPTDEPVPRPPFWGGLVIEPRYIEFWSEQEGRLHQRVGYESQDSKEGTDWSPMWIFP